MRIKYLGTAAAEAWPGIFCHCKNCEEARRLGGKNIRTRAQVLLDETILMDFGPDTFLHSFVHGVDLAKVHTVLLTHSHTDHWYPSELILRGVPYAFDLEKYPLTVYGNEKCREIYQRTVDFENDSPTMKDCVNFQTIAPFSPFTVKGYQITPLKATHDDFEQCIIFSICDQANKRMMYGNDTGFWSEETWKQIEGNRYDLVSLDCTMGIEAGGYGHMSFSDNLKVKERMLEIGCADEKTVFISTHFSHTCGLEYEAFQNMAGQHQVIIAYDGMDVEI